MAGSALSKLVSVLIMGKKNGNAALFAFSPVLFDYVFIQNLLAYLGCIIFGSIFYFSTRKEYKFKIVSENRMTSISLGILKTKKLSG